MMTISDKEFGLIRALVYERFGINLTEQKRALVVGRLQKFLRNEGFQSFKDYYDHLVGDGTGEALIGLVNRITTNYTYFNRERAHFDFFTAQALPAVMASLQAQQRRDLRIWCAGCSTGEEPYMLAMLVMEFLGKEYGLWDAGVLATDISGRALARARTGVYTTEQIRQLPTSLKLTYFSQNRGGDWRVNDRLRKEVVFRRLNLMNALFPFKKPFQVIFCRNVMIYFDRPTRDALVERFHRFLDPGGYLFIGHSETLGREQTDYRYLMPAVYQRI